MHKRRKLTFNNDYQGHPIITNPDTNLACDEKILETIKTHMDAAVDRRSRNMLLRYDIRLPEGCTENSNQLFSSIQADFIKHLNREGLSPKYIAVREESNNKPHYHGVLLLDYKKTRNPYGHLHKLNEIATRKVFQATGQQISQGLVEFCDKDPEGNPQPNIHIIKRNDPDSYNEAFKRASYLAKISTKPKKHTRELFASRL